MGRHPFERTTPDHKRCPKCDLTRSARLFATNRKAHDGLASWCKYCASDYHRIYMRKLRAGRSPDTRERA